MTSSEKTGDVKVDRGKQARRNGIYHPHGFLMICVLKTGVTRAIALVVSVCLKREPPVDEPAKGIRLRLWDLGCARNDPATFFLTVFEVAGVLITLATKYAIPSALKNNPAYTSISISSISAMNMLPIMFCFILGDQAAM